MHGVLLKRGDNISYTMATSMWFDSSSNFFYFLCCVFNFWKCKVKRLNVFFCSFFAIGCLIWGLVVIFLFCSFVFSLLWNFGLEIGNIHHHELKAIEFNILNMHFVIYVIWLVVLSLGDNQVFFNCSNFLTINNQQ
jgi:hypothetical protein